MICFDLGNIDGLVDKKNKRQVKITMLVGSVGLEAIVRKVLKSVKSGRLERWNYPERDSLKKNLSKLKID